LAPSTTATGDIVTDRLLPALSHPDAAELDRATVVAVALVGADADADADAAEFVYQQLDPDITAHDCAALAATLGEAMI
jgi:hypothetical protein